MILSPDQVRTTLKEEELHIHILLDKINRYIVNHSSLQPYPYFYADSVFEFDEFDSRYSNRVLEKVVEELIIAGWKGSSLHYKNDKPVIFISERKRLSY